ncbi:MAG: YciI family protein [Alphaproteobacteria bacterium]
MIFIIRCIDRPGALETRLKARPQHLDYLTTAGKAVVFAGPILGDDGQTIRGSLIIAEAKDRAAAGAFAAADPYNKAGVFASVEISPTRAVFSNPAPAA